MTAYHTPISVPLHWQEDVKAGLDRDVRLGVLEQVPLGEPVTWCHRMVICAKKNGKPRRTIDFQPLNAHAGRETHHTQSPFHQARSVPQGKKKTVFDAWNGYGFCIRVNYQTHRRAVHHWERLVFTGIEGAGLVIVQQILLELDSIGFRGRIWEGSWWERWSRTLRALAVRCDAVVAVRECVAVACLV